MEPATATAMEVEATASATTMVPASAPAANTCAFRQLTRDRQTMASSTCRVAYSQMNAAMTQYYAYHSDNPDVNARTDEQKDRMEFLRMAYYNAEVAYGAEFRQACEMLLAEQQAEGPH